MGHAKGSSRGGKRAGQPTGLPRVPSRPRPVMSWLDFTPARVGEDQVPELAEAIERSGFGDHTGRFGPARGKVGFQDGGPADVMPPCSVLAELTGQALDRMGELTDDELVGVMRAARRVQSWQAAVELQAVGELATRRAAEPQGPGPRPAERAAAEVAVALTMTGQAADAWTGLAAGLERLEPIGDALPPERST